MKQKTLVLIALPGSGKSELRRYMDVLSRDQCREEFGIGRTVQLDDYPYVSFMRAIDLALMKVLHHDPIFFHGAHGSLQNPWNWGTLIELLNEDYTWLTADGDPMHVNMEQPYPALWLFDRINRAQERVGINEHPLQRFPPDVLNVMGQLLHDRSSGLLTGMTAESIVRDILIKINRGVKDDETVVIEFARGGPHGAHMPLEKPLGYRHSLRLLAPHILNDCAIIYLDVGPEESRRKNFARAVPPPGVKMDETIYHGVPLQVMLDDYGCDDYADLVAQSQERTGQENCIEIPLSGGTTSLLIPSSVFDNRDDKTSFVREPDPSQWELEDRMRLHNELKRAMRVLS